jgi:hypothetical protein
LKSEERSKCRDEEKTTGEGFEEHEEIFIYARRITMMMN